MTVRSAVPRPIHPFPARMAPELAFNVCRRLRPPGLVVDPMVGSGTTVRSAIESGHRALGFDMDPLAVLMSKVWTTPVAASELVVFGEDLLARAMATRPNEVHLPWIDGDDETSHFVDRWFGHTQRGCLRALAAVLADEDHALADPCRVALSRIIVTKEPGASLARDTSHSRPHRVATTSDYDVWAGFRRSLNLVAGRLEADPPPGGAVIAHGDARDLPVPDGIADVVITSPPYLNAIDYLRGHRMSLVWLGHRVGELRQIRGDEIGAERGGNEDQSELSEVLKRMGATNALPERTQRIICRYVDDLRSLLRSIARILKPGGRAVLVVGNSSVRGVFLRNDVAVRDAAVRAGLEYVWKSERQLPSTRRYLPPPSSAGGDLDQRMRTETVLRFRKPEQPI